MPTKYMSDGAFGGCELDKLYVLTAAIDVDISNGNAQNITVSTPAGSLLILRGLNRGVLVKKPCIAC